LQLNAERNYRVMRLCIMKPILGLLLAFSLYAARLAGQAPASGQVSVPSFAPAAQPTFAVATFKPNKTGGPAILRPTGDGFRASNVTLHMLIANAYENGNISGEPGWANLDRYDLEAKVDDAGADGLNKLDGNARVHMLDLALQKLLVERCGLLIYATTKEVPAYSLVPGRGVGKMKPEGPSDPALPNGSLRVTRGQAIGQGVPVERLAQWLTGQLGRPVLDQTGMQGRYSFTLTWEAGDAPEPASVVQDGPPSAPGADDPRAVIPAALEKQLGLRLEPAKTSMGVLVVDYLERPSAN
jgi:uncharacterized protein (TIGR03435 family)